MKTRKNLAKTMLMNILTAGVFATALTACSDEINMTEASDAAPIENNALMNLEQYSYSVPVRVDVQGDWQVDLQFSDEENMFCYALPDHGHGPATIKLCLLDNWTAERNEGKMIIRDLDNAGNNKVLSLRQKCDLDNPDFSGFTRGDDAEGTEEKKPENESKIGERTSGVGYGYNITKKPGDDAVARNPIIKIEALKAAADEGCGITYSQSSVQIRGEQYGASSISELARKMEVSSEIKGSRGGFAAEAKATFSESQIENTSNMFGLGLVDVKVRSAYLEGIDYDNVRDFMTEKAKKAIDGTGRSYPSTPEGFKRLIKDYGSHLIVKADLGGRLRYGTTCDKQYCKSESEIKALASCSYKNKIVEASCKASAEKKKLYESKKSHIKTTISAIGGDYELAAELYGEGNDTEANVKAWMKSLKDEDNLAVVGFGQEDAIELWPLYELIDPEKNPERYNALKDYMENGMIQDDALDGTGTYSNRDILRIKIPSIDELLYKYGNGKTLVYEVWDNNSGHMVAVICNEYIPQITTNGRVMTIYQVENNQPNYMKGRFLGDENNPACNIEWKTDGTVTFKDRADKKGMESTLYLRASELFTSSETTLSNSNIIDCAFKGRFMVGQRCNDDVSCLVGHTMRNGEFVYDDSWTNKLKYNDNYQYPLVKIGNRIWLRENFSGNIPHGSHWKQRYGVKVVDGKVYYTHSAMVVMSTPKGWRIAKNADFENLKQLITSKVGQRNIGQMMQEGGTTGFEMEWNGWYTYSFKYDKPFFGGRYGWMYYDHKFQSPNGNHHMEYYTKEGYPYGHVEIKDNAFEVKTEKDNYYWCKQIRLVME